MSTTHESPSGGRRRGAQDEPIRPTVVEVPFPESVYENYRRSLTDLLGDKSTSGDAAASGKVKKPGAAAG